MAVVPKSSGEKKERVPHQTKSNYFKKREKEEKKEKNRSKEEQEKQMSIKKYALAFLQYTLLLWPEEAERIVHSLFSQTSSDYQSKSKIREHVEYELDNYFFVNPNPLYSTYLLANEVLAWSDHLKSLSYSGRDFKEKEYDRSYAELRNSEKKLEEMLSKEEMENTRNKGLVPNFLYTIKLQRRWKKILLREKIFSTEWEQL